MPKCLNLTFVSFLFTIFGIISAITVFFIYKTLNSESVTFTRPSSSLHYINNATVNPAIPV